MAMLGMSDARSWGAPPESGACVAWNAPAFRCRRSKQSDAISGGAGLPVPRAVGSAGPSFHRRGEHPEGDSR
eukprot:8327332-Pyramimonas_sp.AAC.1